MHRILTCVLLVVLALPTASVRGQQAERPSSAEASQTPPAGHSVHGEIFNEGPRQKAYLMDGTGRVNFPVTTSDPLAGQFVAQGVGQLHGFWYFESERSFRQAAAIDPQCAMAYWGMAMSNLGNEKRARGFIERAMKLKDKVTERERMYIVALDNYLRADKEKKADRAAAYTQALERLLYKFPDDVEAKAFLALQLWKNRSEGLKISSYLAVDALLQQVFAVEPMHPAHHYRIHLWDYEQPEVAVSSAAVCGQSAPAIAHMWHMPGHIFSRLKRYNDAAWQQEASARVDHAHMIRDRVMPDQIHNFAHNNEWLIRNLVHVGRTGDALDLAKNMTELPRHPKYNSIEKRGSAQYGRLRLLQTLTTFELWDPLIALAETPYLEPTDSPSEQVKRLRHLGAAHFRRGDAARGGEVLETLRQRREARTTERDDAAAAAVAKAKEEDQKDDEVKKLKQDAERPFREELNALRSAIDELEGLELVDQGQIKEGLERLRKAGGVDAVYLARLQCQADDKEPALKSLRQHVERHPGEVQPLAGLIDLLWQDGQREEARQQFDKLREVSSAIDFRIPSPVFERLAPIAAELGLPADWRLAASPADDIGQRPDLDSLGPFRWRPSPAPDWTLKDGDEKTHALKQFSGRPVVLIFYLGYGCLHCAEQLQAFAPMADKFREAGIELVAISSDDREGLRKSQENYTEGRFPFPLLADPQLHVFKEYRAYDDFEQAPLHGTFLIDGQGLVRWQDISFEPFMDPAFVLTEAQRLLAQDPLASP